MKRLPIKQRRGIQNQRHRKIRRCGNDKKASGSEAVHSTPYYRISSVFGKARDAAPSSGRIVYCTIPDKGCRMIPREPSGAPSRYKV